MNREERLEFCKICLNRQLDFKRGLVCKFTNDLADFEHTCGKFEEDSMEKDRLLLRDLSVAGHGNANKSINPKLNKNLGIIIFAIGVAILFFTFAFANSFGIIVIPFGAILFGARTYYKGLEQEKILAERKTKEE